MPGLSSRRLLAAAVAAVALSGAAPAAAAGPASAAPQCIGYFPAGEFVWDIGLASINAGPYAVLYCQDEGSVTCYVQTAVGSAVVQVAGSKWTVAGTVLGLTFYGDQLDSPRPECFADGGRAPLVDFAGWSPPRTMTLRIAGFGNG